MKSISPETKARLRSRSRLVHLGRDGEASQGFVNVPPYRGSTVLFPDVATLSTENQRYTYGTHGTPTTDALCEAWTALAGAAGTALVPTGMAAIALALLSAVGAGDHLLMTDSAYQPARRFCDGMLKRMGVETTYYDPRLGAGIASLFRPNTKAVFVESPGSQSLEVQDIPAIAEVAHARGACVVADNTWATPLFFPPHAKGVDLAIEAGTKYLSGHSDLLLGLVSANADWLKRLRRAERELAIPAGPEDVYLALRGLRTMELRLREAERQGLALAEWLGARPEVLSVIHPARPDHPDHALWKRDFAGSSGLFSVVLKPVSAEARRGAARRARAVRPRLFLGRLREPGHSVRLRAYRTATRWAPGGPALRFSVGLEDIEDLKDDLARGFERMKAAS